MTTQFAAVAGRRLLAGGALGVPDSAFALWWQMPLRNLVAMLTALMRIGLVAPIGVGNAAGQCGRTEQSANSGYTGHI